MQKHSRIYLEFFGYEPGDFIPSELSGLPAQDIHHIDCRGMGGTTDKDDIENLIALTRREHVKFGDKKQYMAFLKRKHLKFMKLYGKK